MAQGEQLALAAEQDLLVGDEAGQAHAVDGHAAVGARPRDVCPAPGGAVEGGPRRLGHEPRRAQRRARRRVELVLLVHLDDLGALVVPRRFAAKRMSSTAPRAKLGTTSRPASGGRGLGGEVGDLVVGEAGGADDGRHAGREERGGRCRRPRPGR